MEEPMSLWDRGMDRIEGDVDEAKDYVKDELGIIAFAWPSYDWDNNEINITLSILHYQGEMTHEDCNKLRGLFLDGFGFPREAGEDRRRNATIEMISYWFSHTGFTRNSRDKDLAEKLSRIIFVEVNMWGSVEKGLSCRDRILTLDAPSKPLS